MGSLRVKEFEKSARKSGLVPIVLQSSRNFLSYYFLERVYSRVEDIDLLRHSPFQGSTETRFDSETRISSANFLLSLILSSLSLASTLLSLDAQLWRTDASISRRELVRLSCRLEVGKKKDKGKEKYMEEEWNYHGPGRNWISDRWR